MKYAAITSFSPKGDKIYADTFVETFLEHFPDDWILTLVYEGEKPVRFKHDRILMRDLLEDDDHNAFQKFLHTPQADPRCRSIHPRWGCEKWCKKVFAITHSYPDVDWLTWIDADAWATKKIDDRFLAAVYPEGKDVTYLGRRHWPYSECGYVGYRLSAQHVRVALQRMRQIYMTKEVFKYAEWGDSYVFDVARRECIPKDRWNDLGAIGIAVTHIWPKTILGEYMTHEKGQTRKQERYGGTC